MAPWFHPLHLSAKFAFDGFGEKRDYDYTRSGNPTRDALGAALAELEGGAGAVVTSTGIAAVDAGHAAAAPGPLGGAARRLRRHVSAVRTRRRAGPSGAVRRPGAGALAAALAGRPRLVWVETPSNPLLRIIDIARRGRRAKAAGALVVVDNTFLSPVWQHPLASAPTSSCIRRRST